MSYQYNRVIDTLLPVEVTDWEVDGTLSTAKFHTLQCMGSPVTVEIKIANNGTYLNIGTFTNEAENINAFGITKLRLTVPTGSADISIAGTKNGGGC